MLKTHKKAIITCTAALVCVTGVNVCAAGYVKKFADENGRKILVHCRAEQISSSDEEVQKRLSIMEGSEEHGIGDIIVVDGIEEKMVSLLQK